MNNRQIIGLAVRLFAIFLVVYTLRYLPSLTSAAFEQRDDGYLKLIMTISFGISPIIIAILLWHFPLTVAAKLLPEINRQNDSSALSSSEQEVLAFTVLGLWVLAKAIPDLFFWATYAFRLSTTHIPNEPLTAKAFGLISATLLEVTIGFWLLLGSKGISNLLQRLRYGKG